MFILFFFFNDTAPTEIYTLSLHDALPIFPADTLLRVWLETGRTHQIRAHLLAIGHPVAGDPEYGAPGRHGLERQDRKSTRLELQSRQYLVCRLLLEKKHKKNHILSYLNE